MSKSTILWLADNLDYLRTQTEAGCKDGIQNGEVDLIYIDPPFNSKRNYNILFDAGTNSTEQAFTDTWSNVAYLDLLPEINRISPCLYSFITLLQATKLPESNLSYLTHMAIRCYYMRLMLRDTGSFYYHCDPTMSHYIKVVLDYIFGQKNFRNEIVWCYDSSGRPKNCFAKKHDIILLYSKTDLYLFNGLRDPHSKEELVRDYRFYDENGRRYRTSKVNGKEYRYYADEGKMANDYWLLNSINSNSHERLGYPTQKPVALLERVIRASTNEGDLVADFFLGGGTTAQAAYTLGRRFLGCDINYRAIQITKERLEKLGAVLKKDLIVHGIPASSVDLRNMVSENVIGTSKNSRFELEDVVVKYYLKGVVGNEIKVGDNSIDGTFGFTFDGKQRKGLVQVTCGSNKNHLKAFCSEVGKGTGDMGVYIAFKDQITDGFIKEAKGYGKIGDVDKVQILTLEDLIDNKQQFELPYDGVPKQKTMF